MLLVWETFNVATPPPTYPWLGFVRVYGYYGLWFLSLPPKFLVLVLPNPNSNEESIVDVGHARRHPRLT